MADKRVLVVEDHASVRTLIRVILETDGYRVVEANDGREAVESAESLKPELIVLDLMMPGMDGEKVIEELRDKAETKEIPILVVTAKEEAVGRVGEVLGRENVIQKPFEESQITERVAEIIGPGQPSSTSPWKGPPRR
jgi:CheY-like chemotaxis protein